MFLDQLIAKSGLTTLSQGGSGNPDIGDIVYDSREVKPGCVYVAIPGTKVHGDSFIKDACANGAVCIISETPQVSSTVPWLQVKNARAALGILGSTLWNIDINKIKTVGITGTNGKTTVAHLFETLFEQLHGHQNVWMFGTIDYHVSGERKPATHTTPEALTIFRMIGTQPVRPEVVVMEVSSHSLALDRVEGLTYDLAVWTNLTQDHLDFHKTMDTYYSAKKTLFTKHLKNSGVCAINIDDPWGRKLAGELNANVMTYGRAEDAKIKIDKWECSWDGCKIDVVDNGTPTRYSCSLRGFFNVYNVTALIAGARALGISSDIITNALESIETVPGRMDRVTTIDAPFSVIVDYAHTPDALVNVLTTARPLTNGRLICVFGCGGDRDRTKRPIMGNEVSRNCDEAFVTSDNPRSEKAETIINEIIKGIPLDFSHHVIVDRREAIHRALSVAKAGDCIVIAGKGHEDYQEIKGVRYHFNDKEVVTELYATMRSTNA